MTTQPTSYLLPKDTLDNLRTLAKDVGNMSGVLLHTIEVLESSLLPLATKTPEDQIGELLSRFDGVASSLGQIATRVAALESHGSEVVKAESSLPPMAESAPINVHEKTGKDAPQADTTTADQDKKTNRRDYSLDVRRMAVDMRKKGKKSADIIIAIHNQCGYAPDKSNLQTRLNRWEKELDSSSAPLAQNAVLPSRSTVADRVHSRNLTGPKSRYHAAFGGAAGASLVTKTCIKACRAKPVKFVIKIPQRPESNWDRRGAASK